MSLFVFDLDGTLSDHRHRLNLITPDPNREGHRNWDAYHAACDKDGAHEAVLRVFRSLLDNGQVVEIWTGRNASVRLQTDEWLRRHAPEWHRGSFPRTLQMRPTGDFTPSPKLKERWWASRVLRGETVSLVFEDQPSVVEMWRGHGVLCAALPAAVEW